MGIERPIDFSKPRVLRCRCCGHRATFKHTWIERWKQGKEGCPQCGITSDNPESAVYDWDFSDLVSDDQTVLKLNWYHTTTHSVWPNPNFDPEAGLSTVAKEGMRKSGNPNAVENWVAKQKSKALHIGTYEAAIENMLRQLDTQRQVETQYYLYRVNLHQTSIVTPGVNQEPKSILGDMTLPELGLTPEGIYRYINQFEDEGSISLAIGKEAIASVQRITIPLLPDTSSLSKKIERELDAAETRKPQSQQDVLETIRKRPLMTNPYEETAQNLWDELSQSLPERLRPKFCRARDPRIRDEGNEAYSKVLPAA